MTAIDADISELIDDPGITTPSSLGTHLLNTMFNSLFQIKDDLKTKFAFDMSKCTRGRCSRSLLSLGLTVNRLKSNPIR